MGGTRTDFGLITYYLFWYLGNYYYNITNRLALNAAGGKTGFPVTISALQLGVGSIYGLFLWLAPDARAKPKVTWDDIVKMIPVAFCFMGAHSASVLAMGMGAVSFAKIVGAAEPAFAAVLSQFVYGKKVSKAKWLCLPFADCDWRCYLGVRQGVGFCLGGLDFGVYCEYVRCCARK